VRVSPPGQPARTYTTSGQYLGGPSAITAGPRTNSSWSSPPSNLVFAFGG
jgi:hypothetical protein